MKLKIKILGTGCAKCETLKQLTEEVTKENNINATIEKVEDIAKIMEHNVMSTPALVVNEQVTIKGRIPPKKELLEILLSESNPNSEENQSSCCCGSDDCC